jgi:5-methylcytosine-specific restriction endonuclease McrA
VLLLSRLWGPLLTINYDGGETSSDLPLGFGYSVIAREQTFASQPVWLCLPVKSFSVAFRPSPLSPPPGPPSQLGKILKRHATCLCVTQFQWYISHMKRGRPRLASNCTCEVCKEEFYKPPSHLAKWPARTCSRGCAAVLRRSDRVERQCRHCGKSFAARADQVAKGFGIYCSNRCNGLATLTKVDLPCRWCSTTVSVPFHRYANTKKIFCGVDCRIEWQRRFGTKKGVNAFSSEQKAAWLDSACCRCGTTECLELDHIIPRFAGGKATRDNAQTLCRKCNREKFWLEDLERYKLTRKQAVAG